MSMFKYADNDLGYIQVLINSDNKKELESLGFVDQLDKVKAPTKKKTVKAKAKKDA